MKLSGRGVLITGASTGFGKAVAQACIAEGADVLLCSRNEEALRQTRDELAAQAGKNQAVLFQVADVADPAAVEMLVKTAGEQLPAFTGVVNNAGVYGPMGRLEDTPLEEWAAAIAINLLGTMQVCRAVLPGFRKRGYGKIVNLSGGGATAPLPNISSYAASKAAVVRLTETLAEETQGAGIDINSVAPGALNTRLLEEVIEAGPEKVGSAFYDRALKQKQAGGAPLEKGAGLCVYLLSSQSDGISGRLISAIWDPWETLTERKQQLQETDVYTLRRIVPKDRGLDWD